MIPALRTAQTIAHGFNALDLQQQVERCAGNLIHRFQRGARSGSHRYQQGRLAERRKEISSHLGIGIVTKP